jgi:hypothetical protein
VTVVSRTTPHNAIPPALVDGGHIDQHTAYR